MCGDATAARPCLSVSPQVARLCISWSKLEPKPGVYDETYLQRLEQMVGWAAEQDVYVFIDFHQVKGYGFGAAGEGLRMWACGLRGQG